MRAAAPGAMPDSGVRAVSTSLENIQQCPARMRTSSRRFSTSSGVGESVIVARVYGMPASMSSSHPTQPNRLARETSPYLLQHAQNPVDWHPWGEPAFAAARASGKPVLLSIGYSACHWCHVMAHESFEDPATAAVMNELFINIKVDREERPDVDRIYQLAHQLLTRRAGGWPLTMFLCHDDQRPFFGGTYFPPQPRHGMPAFTDLLRRVSQVYREHAAELRGQSAALVEALESIDAPAAPQRGMLTDAPQFARVAAATGEFLLRDLRDPRGAFHAAWDADSEGHEGLYYLWTPEQVRAALEAPSAERFIADYGLDRPPNFEGRWHLVAAREPEEPAADAADRATLLQLRMQRVPPGRDDKILTGWNALAIGGLADAARALDRPEFAAAAAAALEFLMREHWRNGRLLATSRNGDARLDAYLDDHAYLLAAILSLLTVRFESGWLHFATGLADALLERFEDREHGGFFFTAHDHEALIHRSRNFHDDATPSGNAIAAAALLRLGWLLGEPRYLESAERTLRAAWSSLADAPLGQVAMSTTLGEYLQPQRIVILRGEAAEIDLWRRELQRIWRPDVSVLAIPADAPDLPPALASKAPQPGTVAYLCRGSTCSAPLDTLPALLQALRVPAADAGSG